VALTLTSDQYGKLHRLIAHMSLCKVCARHNGTVAGLRGCAVGHQLAVQASLIIREQMRTGGILPGHREAQ
jgi:hypothetical protein